MRRCVFEANLLLLLMLRLLLLFGMKQDATNDEARMMNDELPPIARRKRSCRGDLEIVR